VQDMELECATCHLPQGSGNFTRSREVCSDCH